MFAQQAATASLRAGHDEDAAHANGARYVALSHGREGARVLLTARQNYHGEQGTRGHRALRFRRGEQIELLPPFVFGDGKLLEQHEARPVGMWKGRIGTREGWFPDTAVYPPIALARQPYDAKSSDELSFGKGARLLVETTLTADHDWWLASLEGRPGAPRGLVPSNFLEIVGGHKPELRARLSRRPTREASAAAADAAADPAAAEGAQGAAHGGYSQLANLAGLIVHSAPFQALLVTVVLACTLLMGLGTYSATQGSAAVRALAHVFDVLTLLTFLVELGLKLLANGRTPHHLFLEPSDGHACAVRVHWWEIFNLAIVIQAVVGLTRGAPGGWVRSLRVVQLGARAVGLKRAQGLYAPFIALLYGMGRGIASSLYIILLMTILFYLWAVVGVSFLGENDPKHFHDLRSAFLTLYQLTTMDGWGEVMDTSAQGCDRVAYEQWAGAGYACDAPRARPVFGPLYFVSFTLVSGLIVVSLFVGVSTVAMQSALDAQHAEQLRKRPPERNRKTREDVAFLEGQLARAWQPARDVLPWSERDWRELAGWEEGWRKRLAGAYVGLAAPLERAFRTDSYEQAMVLPILASAILIGIETEAPQALPRESAIALDGLVVFIFTAEAALKLASTGLRPGRFFRSAWNVLDLVIVVLNWLPDAAIEDMRQRLAQHGGPPVNQSNVLRMVRLLRVVKLFSAVGPLQLIVEGLVNGVLSIGLIFAMLVLLMYSFAVLGVNLFGENDPAYFGSLERALTTLYQCATLDNWTERLHVNMYGCDAYGYEEAPALCTRPRAQVLVAAAYFTVYTITASFVLLNFFVGVVTSSMERATQEHARLANLGPQQRKRLQLIFEVVDEGGSGAISKHDFERVVAVGRAQLLHSRTLARSDSVLRAFSHSSSMRGQLDFPEFISALQKVDARLMARFLRGVAEARGNELERRASALPDALPRPLATTLGTVGLLAAWRRAAERAAADARASADVLTAELDGEDEGVGPLPTRSGCVSSDVRSGDTAYRKRGGAGALSREESLRALVLLEHAAPRAFQSVDEGAGDDDGAGGGGGGGVPGGGVTAERGALGGAKGARALSRAGTATSCAAPPGAAALNGAAAAAGEGAAETRAALPPAAAGGAGGAEAEAEAGWTCSLPEGTLPSPDGLGEGERAQPLQMAAWRHGLAELMRTAIGEVGSEHEAALWRHELFLLLQHPRLKRQPAGSTPSYLKPHDAGSAAGGGGGGGRASAAAEGKAGAGGAPSPSARGPVARHAAAAAPRSPSPTRRTSPPRSAAAGSCAQCTDRLDSTRRATSAERLPRVARLSAAHVGTAADRSARALSPYRARSAARGVAGGGSGASPARCARSAVVLTEQTTAASGAGAAVTSGGAGTCAAAASAKPPGAAEPVHPALRNSRPRQLTVNTRQHELWQQQQVAAAQHSGTHQSTSPLGGSAIGPRPDSPDAPARPTSPERPRQRQYVTLL